MPARGGEKGQTGRGVSGLFSGCRVSIVGGGGAGEKRGRTVFPGFPEIPFPKGGKRKGGPRGGGGGTPGRGGSKGPAPLFGMAVQGPGGGARRGEKNSHPPRGSEKSFALWGGTRQPQKGGPEIKRDAPGLGKPHQGAFVHRPGFRWGGVNLPSLSPTIFWRTCRVGRLGASPSAAWCTEMRRCPASIHRARGRRSPDDHRHPNTRRYRLAAISSSMLTGGCSGAPGPPPSAGGRFKGSSGF